MEKKLEQSEVELEIGLLNGIEVRAIRRKFDTFVGIQVSWNRSCLNIANRTFFEPNIAKINFSWCETVKYRRRRLGLSDINLKKTSK